MLARLVAVTRDNSIDQLQSGALLLFSFHDHRPALDPDRRLGRMLLTVSVAFFLLAAVRWQLRRRCFTLAALSPLTQ